MNIAKYKLRHGNAAYTYLVRLSHDNLHSPKILFSTFHVGKESRPQPYPAVTIMNSFITSTYQNLAPAEHFYGDTCSILGDRCSRIILKQLFIIYFKLRLVKYFYSAVTLYFDKYID
ncbi:hypothetical protein T07_7912 [Trichinella nelsoni]|uniref:Uncharacterized protein n=1 Tax=Trichinella nelsoni TaxID=6336 RepID=A0A0V0S533_9BILA|nr:hypothetical protein T07_7912 [Trichinella nelsoni]